MRVDGLGERVRQLWLTFSMLAVTSERHSAQVSVFLQNVALCELYWKFCASSQNDNIIFLVCTIASWGEWRCGGLLDFVHLGHSRRSILVWVVKSASKTIALFDQCMTDQSWYDKFYRSDQSVLNQMDRWNSCVYSTYPGKCKKSNVSNWSPENM